MTGGMTGEGELTVPRRFNGPPSSANGGYLAGRLAAYAGARAGSGTAVAVTLRRPPPLQTPLRVVADGDRPGAVRLLRGDSVLAEAAPGALRQPAPAAVGWAAADAASLAYPGLTASPFPGCFTCGPDRAPGDGLRLFPGRLPERPDGTACPWEPAASVADPDGAVLPEVVWAALDCPGGWTMDLGGRPAVLGRITAVVDRLPRTGERYVLVGQWLGVDGRKSFTATALYDAGGGLLARAEQVWIAVDPATVRPAAD